MYFISVVLAVAFCGIPALLCAYPSATMESLSNAPAVIDSRQEGGSMFYDGSRFAAAEPVAADAPLPPAENRGLKEITVSRPPEHRPAELSRRPLILAQADASGAAAADAAGTGGESKEDEKGGGSSGGFATGAKWGFGLGLAIFTGSLLLAAPFLAIPILGWAFAIVIVGTALTIGLGVAIGMTLVGGLIGLFRRKKKAAKQ